VERTEHYPKPDLAIQTSHKMRDHDCGGGVDDDARVAGSILISARCPQALGLFAHAPTYEKHSSKRAQSIDPQQRWTKNTRFYLQLRIQHSELSKREPEVTRRNCLCLVRRTYGVRVMIPKRLNKYFANYGTFTTKKSVAEPVDRTCHEVCNDIPEQNSKSGNKDNGELKIHTEKD
jgi:hypothetical protein